MSMITHVLQCYTNKNQRPSTMATQKNVFVSLTTTPVRINKMWPTLNSILLQSQRPEKIYLWIPNKYRRFPHYETLQLPDFIKCNPSIHVEFIENDFGPATKLLPFLRLNLHPDTKIIVIDDDRIYPRHLIRELLKHEQSEPNAAIGVGGGVVFGSLYRQYNSTKKITMVDFLLGSQGYLVKPRFFSTDVFDYPGHLPEAFFEDDMWFGGHLRKMGIRCMLIPSTPSIQSFISQHKKTIALCRNENKSKQNLMRVFDSFR